MPKKDTDKKRARPVILQGRFSEDEADFVRAQAVDLAENFNDAAELVEGADRAGEDDDDRAPSWSKRGKENDRTAFQTEAARQNQASDGCTGDGVPPAVDQRYDFHEIGCHLGNVAKVYFGADSGVANRLILQQMHQNRHPYGLRRKFISRKFLG